MRHFLLPIATAVSLLTAAVFAGEPNTLSADEKSAGWKLLFDGKTFDGWQPIGKAGVPIKGWVVQDGAIFLAKGAGGGDIVTVEQFGDFELTFEWKIAEGGNSGLKYNLINPAKAVGFEYQLLDDDKHPDGRARGTRRQSGALYDLIEPSADRKVKPVGEWNESRIVVKGAHVEQWLNGVKSVEFDFGSDDLKERIAGSKYKGMANFGVKSKSPILVQDHHDEASFRSLKVRVLDAK